MFQIHNSQNFHEFKTYFPYQSISILCFTTLETQHIQQILVLYNRMNSTQEDLNQAIRDLQIRTSNSSEDRQELYKILFQILGYPLEKRAHNHHKANSMGQNDLLQRQRQLQQDIREGKIQNHEVCSCCGLFIRNQKLPFCVDFDQLKIGMGVVLFFKNYLYNAVIFLLMFFIYSIFSFVTNLDAASLGITAQTVMCFIEGSDQRCGLVSIGAGSKIFADHDQMIEVQSWIGVAFVSLWGIANMIKSHYQRKLEIEMQTKRVSASDFTLMITNFPKIYFRQSYQNNLSEINKIFKRYSETNNSLFSYEVVKYNIGRPLYEENQLVKDKKQKALETLKSKQQIFRNWIRYRQHHLQFPIDFQTRNAQYDKYIDFYSEYDIATLEDVQLPQKNVVFLTMRSSKATQEICKYNKPPSWLNLWNLCHENNFPILEVQIQKAPQPEQIKWQKIGFPQNKKYIRKLIIWLITLALIAISFGISISIAFVNTDRINQYISIGISIVITIANILIQFAIMFLSYLENQQITSIEQSNIAFKIGISQLINSIGVPILVTIIVNNNDNVPDKTWLKSGGLVQDVFFIAVFNIFVPLGRLVDPYQLFLKFKRWIYSDPQRRLQMYGQKQLNQHYGNYIFDIGFEYAYLIKTAIFTSFFACMQPIIVLFAPIGLLIYYLSDKRNLLNHFQRPSYHYSTINDSVDIILLFCPIAFGFGHLLVNNFISEVPELPNSILLANIIMVAISVIFLFLVPLHIFYCCIEQPQFPLWDYYDKKPVIPTDYDRSNPITQAQAIGDFQSYLHQLQSKQELPNEGQMMMVTLSNIRLANKRNSGKFQMQSMIRSNSILPQYNTDLNQYEDYLKKGEKNLRNSSKNRLQPLNYNHKKLQETEHQLRGNFGNMTSSYTYQDNNPSINYPNLEDQYNPRFK